MPGVNNMINVKLWMVKLALGCTSEDPARWETSLSLEVTSSFVTVRMSDLLAQSSAVVTMFKSHVPSVL